MELSDKHQGLLRRVATINLAKDARYIVKSLLVEPGTTLSKGAPTIELAVTRTRRRDNETIDETLFETRRFEIDAYQSPSVLEIIAPPGSQLEPGSAPIFSYVVEESFSNLVEEAIQGIAHKMSDLYRSPSIPEKKLKNATDGYGKKVEKDRVLYLYDDTVFGSATDGFLVTDSAFHYSSNGTVASVRFNEIKGVRVEEDPSNKNPFKRRNVVVSLPSGDVACNESWTALNVDGLERFFTLAMELGAAGRTKQVDGYVIVEEMPDPVKLAYLGLLVWFTFQGDQRIDDRELSELQVLMTQLRCSAELRHKVRAFIGQPDKLDAAALFADMQASTPSGSGQALGLSLVKDAVRLFRATAAGAAMEQQGVMALANLVGVKPEQVGVLEDACMQDELILKGEISDSQITTMAKTFAAKASAVGVPVAAVYLSGSVTGLSAAGITSGLSALGLGGLLGLSSMVTGIGVAIVVGVGVYKGVQWIAGGTERDKASRRELMLQEVLRIHQKSIANLAEDVAYFAQTLVGLMVDAERNKARISKLTNELGMFATAIKLLREKETGIEGALEDETSKRAA